MSVESLLSFLKADNFTLTKVVKFPHFSCFPPYMKLSGHNSSSEIVGLFLFKQLLCPILRDVLACMMVVKFTLSVCVMDHSYKQLSLL